jgi:hypothetical protein
MCGVAFVHHDPTPVYLLRYLRACGDGQVLCPVDAAGA